MTCPICTRPSDKKYRPFCSKRCADIDLGKWLDGAYSVPAHDQDPMEEDLQIQPDQTNLPN